MRANKDLEKIELKINGMTCDSCAIHVKNALKNVEGVIAVGIPGWKSGRAVITVRRNINEEILVKSVEKAGYSASILNRVSPKLTKTVLSKDSGNASYPDLLVIGGGSAGFAAAIRGAELGFSVVLVEKGIMGGTCVNIGCVPSKTLIHAMKQAAVAKNNHFHGVYTSLNNINWMEVIAQKDELVSTLREAKYKNVLKAYKSIRYIEGHAELKKKGVLIKGLSIDSKMYFPKKIIIATGAHPWIPEIQGLSESGYLTSTTVMDLKMLPKSMIVLGGNAIGLELAQVFARAGTSITICELKPQIAPDIEPKLATLLQGYLAKEGIQILTNFQTEKIVKYKNTLTILGRHNGNEITLNAEQLLIATGRRPTTNNLGLEEADIKTGKVGEVLVDSELRTSNPDIYAAGDVTGKDMFVYVAAYAGGLAVENALINAGKRYETDYIPRVIFTDPQVATTGLTEEQAKREGFQVKVSTLPMEYVPKALAAHDTRGLIKLIADSKTDQILGAHIIAPEAGEMIQIAAMAIRFGLTTEELKNTIFPYLTSSEAIKLATLSFNKEVSKLSCCAG